MATQEPTFEEVLSLAKLLPPRLKLRLIEAIVSDLAAPLQQAEAQAQPLRSLYGLWQDLGVTISDQDIDDARAEMWGTFPRDDI